MIEFQNIEIGYSTKRKSKLLVSDINITAKKSELIALIGINGAGKSTLLKTLAKAIPPAKGHIYIQGKSISSYSAKEFAKQVSFVPAENNRPENMTVKEFVSFGRFPYTGFSGILNQQDSSIIDKAILNVGIKDLAQKKITNISSGEFQKALLARSASQETPIILLDEPASFLDIDSKHAVFYLLRKMVDEQNNTIIFSAHDLAAALKIADKIWLIKNGKVHEAAPEDLMINGLFLNFFNSKELVFDFGMADFKYISEPKFAINLKFNTDCLDVATVTTHCLKRNDFYVSEKKVGLSLEIIKKNNIFVWIISNMNTETHYQSVYDLSQELKIIIKQSS